MSNFSYQWYGPTGIMDADSNWSAEIWTRPAADQAVTDSATNEAGPMNRTGAKRRINRFAMLFSALEIQLLIGDTSARLSGLGFYCSKDCGYLNNYTIKVANTQLENLAGGWIEPEKTVWSGTMNPSKNSWFFFGPFSKTEGKRFIWDGSSSLYIELSWVSPYSSRNYGSHKKLLSAQNDSQKIIFCRGENESLCQSTGWELGLTRPVTILKWEI
jgi:hypothetical protein